ncbi:MAG TPA: hypothetical protein PKK61_00365 [Defluviitaleaceae bacterium]|jgi:hypothetical protein|nr:hypothetical protein [Defluviitaleaceae bacterium]
MKKARVDFIKCIQDSQEFGSDNEHMVSRIFFNIDLAGNIQKEMYVDIKQTVGSVFNKDQIEVSFPKNLKGPFNYEEFSKYVKEYYSKLVGSQGSAIRIGEGCSNIRMMNNTFVIPYSVEFEVSDAGTSW